MPVVRAAVTYGGWALAAAAAALLVTRGPPAPNGASDRSPPAPSGSATATSIEQRFLVPAAGFELDVRFDRAFGVGLVKSTRPVDDTLQVWLVFDGDRVPKPVALLAPGKTSVTFGGVCPPEPSVSARCTAAIETIVTRETARGAFTLPSDPAAVLGRAKAADVRAQ